MPRSVPLYSTAQFEEVKTLVNQLAEHPGFPPAEHDKLAAFQADLQQTLREAHRRATGAARLHVAAS